MSKAKLFKGLGIFVNDDLTKLNAEVLASLRLKQPSAVERSWSFEGKLHAVFKGNQQPTQIKHSEYNLWLEKPWPKNLTPRVKKPQLVQEAECPHTSNTLSLETVCGKTSNNYTHVPFLLL
ncbi:hypothetical protein DPMN_104538 [Dreissena polymorpha]|uniref:Uncharacterized protein n=1 Tax=Dreissena polymorpha TaxID=45954 RepID=A0A9D4K182_DREPO|nr:hypothetical protein DPMN_104538 [Dreissena polymorpha]